MDKSNTPTFLIPVLALLALAFPLAMNLRPPGASSGQSSQSSKVETQKPKEGSEKGKEPSPPQHSAAMLIEHFLHSDSDRNAGWTVGDPRNKYSLDFIIATVPDPVDSRFAYFFDSAIDSIQRAFESDSYVLDRFDLPWSETSGAGYGTGADTGREYRQDPGLLLFRGLGKQEHKLFLVFLVGESPTSGLEKPVMASALRQLSSFFPWGPGYNQLPDDLHKLTRNDVGSTIKILGPTFSGSAVSLDFTLRDWLAWVRGGPAKTGKLRPTVQIVSGTATAIDTGKYFMFGKGDSQAFQAVVPPDSVAMKVALGYIRSLGYSRVAMLTEASTAYGQDQKYKSEEKSKTSPKTGRGLPQAPKKESRAERKKPPEPPQPEILNLPFPLHISQLRTASEKQRLSQQQSVPETLNNTPPQVHLQEGEKYQPQETPPSFSQLGVSSADLVLSSLLSTISREGIHAAGILATDVRDTIFLAREIHQHCPGTLVFTVNADLLYAHPDVSASTRGMLVFTPYPLFNLNQVWTPPYTGWVTPGRGASRLQFSSQFAEGVYNATLALLRQETKMLDYGKPFQAGKPKDPAKPALWVTVVGRKGLLPVKLLRWSNDGKYSLTVNRPHERTPAIGEEGIYTAGSVFGIVLLSCILIAFSRLVIHQYHSPASTNGEGRSSWASRLLGEPITRAYRQQARLFLLACLVCLLNAYIVLSAAYFLPAIVGWRLGAVLAGGDVRWLVGLGLAATLVVAGLLSVAVALVLVVDAFRKAHGQDFLLRRPVKVAVLAGCVIVFGLSLRLAGVWVLSAWRSPTEAISTYVRSFEYFSGLSPLVPLFCVALAGSLWAFCSFRRLRMIDGIRPIGDESSGEGAFLGAKTSSFESVEALELKVRERLERVSAFSNRQYYSLILVGLFVWLYLFFFPFVPSYEGHGFYFLFGWAFFLVYFALTAEFGRLCLVWGDLRRLLQCLALHPMRDAYGRYRKSFPGLPRIDLAIPLRTFAVLSFSVDQSEQLLRMASSLRSSPGLAEDERQKLERWFPEAQPAVLAASKNLSEALNWDAAGQWQRAIEGRSRCQENLGKIARMTAEFLEPLWRPENPALPSSEEPLNLQTFREMGEEFLAGRAVLLISYVMPSLRNLGLFVLSGLLLMLFSAISYPFLQRNHFLAFNWIVILSFVALTLVVLLQIERDAVLSMLNGTTPGQVTLTRHFTFRVLTYVMIPILALLSAQFPNTVGQIVSWFSTTQAH